jgi:hypothetical protein
MTAESVSTANEQTATRKILLRSGSIAPNDLQIETVHVAALAVSWYITILPQLRAKYALLHPMISSCRSGRIFIFVHSSMSSLCRTNTHPTLSRRCQTGRHHPQRRSMHVHHEAPPSPYLRTAPLRSGVHSQWNMERQTKRPILPLLGRASRSNRSNISRTT